MNVKITIELSEQRLQDLVCGAFEGGSNYWYLIEDYIYPEGQTKESLGIEFTHIELPFKGGSIIVGDLEDETVHKTLDIKAIESGVKIMARDYPSHFGDWLAENDDAITADVFLQCCIFGEARYG